MSTSSTTHRRPARRPNATVRAALRRGADHRRWQARTGDLLESVAVLSVLGIVAQFLRDGGSHDLAHGDLAAVLQAVGRMTGLVAVDVLLLQLLLSARVPWVDRVYGMDRALRAHRILGRLGVPLVLVHVEALVVSYAVRDRLPAATGWLVEPFRMLTGVPDMVTATISTVLLVVIAVTSVRAAMRTMGYERWHLVHLTAYAAVVLSIPHQLSTGSDLSRNPWVRTYWLGLYVLVAGSVLWWRAVVPVWTTLRQGIRVERVVPEGPGVWSVWMTGRHLDRLSAQAGHYFGWRFLTRGMWASAHPWSLSSRPDGRHLRITVRDLGDHSRRLSELRPGTRVLVEGPYGAFTTSSRTRQRVLLLAAGIGVTPIRALLEELVQSHEAHPGDVTVVVRADSADLLPLHSEIERLVHAGGHRLHAVIGPPVRGSWLPAGVRSGQPTTPEADARRLAALVPNLKVHEVYVCGPGPWMDLVSDSLDAAGVAPAHVHAERFGW